MTSRLSTVDELQSSSQNRPAKAGSDVCAGSNETCTLTDGQSVRVVAFDGGALAGGRTGDGDRRTLGVGVAEAGVGIVEAVLVVAVDGGHRVQY